MQAFSGIVTGLSLVLGLVVGLRLLIRAWAHGGVAEWSLGTYFVVSGFLASLASILAYGTLASDALEFSPASLSGLLGFAGVGMAVGSTGVAIFTWRTFRPGRFWAVGLAAVAPILGIVGFTAELWNGEFVLQLLPGWAHWVSWFGRAFPMVWVGIEAILYWSAARRRARLGLAEPLVVNRFLLWAIWSIAAFVGVAADLGARVAYFWMGGTAPEIDLAVAMPLVTATLSLTSVLGLVSCTSLFLTFFPTAGYERWIAGNADRSCTPGA